MEKAKAEYQESEERLKSLQEKITELNDLKQREAERSRERILQEAEETSAQILSGAREVAESEMRKAWVQLKIELVEAAFQEAEENIREQIKSDDHTRIVWDYIERLSDEDQTN